MSKFPAFTHPAQIPVMRTLVADHPIKHHNFEELLRHYLNSQEMSYPVFGWFYMNRKILSEWLKSL